MKKENGSFQRHGNRHFLMVKKVERNLTTVQLCGERNLAMIFLQKLLNLLLGDEIT